MSIFFSAQTRGFYDTAIHSQIPDDAVEITPAVHRELLTAQSDGAQIQPDDSGYPVSVHPPLPTLDELKEAACVKINRLRDAREQGGFEYLGKTFDSDPISVARIQGAAQAAQIAVLAGSGEGFSMQWKCADNSRITLDAQQMLGAMLALAAHANACHQQADRLKEEVASCTSEEEIEEVMNDA